MNKRLPSSVERTANALLRIRATRLAVGHWPATAKERLAADMKVHNAMGLLSKGQQRPSVREKARQTAAAIKSFHTTWKRG